MIPRIEIEATLSMALHGSRCELPADVAAELCRTWLAVQDAPVVKVRGKVGEFATIWVSHSLVGRRVRLVVEE